MKPRKIISPVGKDWPIRWVLDSVGKGWRKLVTKLLHDLFDAGWNGELHQIKEKYGSLRFYTGGLTQEQSDLIHNAERASRYICEVCGNPGEIKGAYWLQCRCDSCWEKLTKECDD